MVSTSLSTSIALLAGLAAALPRAVVPRQNAPETVIYWGQNGGGTIENNDLSAYCTPEAGVDIIVLAFLFNYGNGADIPSGTIGQSCSISSTGQGQNCEALSSAITTCQSNGVKVVLSLGGAVGSYSLASDAEASTIANYLWKAYGNSGATDVTRPLGSAFVNGFDFDIEANRGSVFYPSMISTLRSNFASDPSNTYFITGAPQCPIPEPNMGSIIDDAQFDYLWPQFYNNNPNCALPVNGNAPFNYDAWVSYTATTPSAGAKLFIGVPAAPLAANGVQSGAAYYATPDQLAEIVSEYKTHDRFSGIMMWAAGFSDSNVINGCTYAQQAKSILTTGATC